MITWTFTETRKAGLACGIALLASLLLDSGTAFAQRPPGGGPSPGGAGGFPLPAAAPEPPRPGGLHIGPKGFTVGDAGGLDLELTRNGAVPPPPPLAADAPPPPADSRDFSGSWYGDQYLENFEIRNDMYNTPVPFNALGRKIADARLMAQDKQAPYMTPTLLCRQSGQPWVLIRIPFQIFQSKDRVDVFPSADRAWWQIPLRPEIALPAGTKSYMGRSIGHWEGDTLVVDITGFKNRIWLDFRGTPLSPNGKLTYRIRKLHRNEGWYLEMVTTVDDSTYYKQPWSFARTFSWRPDFGLIEEYNCEEQNGDKNSNATAGFIAEPVE